MLTGPTASGKTWAAVKLAGELTLEAISADSRQVYRGLDIGTAKPSPQELAALPHHLIGILDPGETYSAGQFLNDALELVPEIRNRGARPLLLGGTGMYLRGFLQGYQFAGSQGDPALRKTLYDRYDAEGKDVLYGELLRLDPAYAAKIHPNDRLRVVRGLEVVLLTGKGLEEAGREPPMPVHGVAILPDKEILAERIARRTEELLENGWIEETRKLLDEGVDENSPGMQSIGYPEVRAHLRGDLTLRQLIQAVTTRTRQYARKQRQLFKTLPNLTVVSSPEEAVEEVLRLVER